MKEVGIDSFYSSCKSEFWLYIEGILFKLKSNDPLYSKIILDIEDELDKFPKLRDVLDDKVVHSLTEEEVNSLLRIIDLQDRKRDIELQEVFFHGGSNAYYYFQRIGILKNCINNGE